jgi:hypothetical protein
MENFSIIISSGNLADDFLVAEIYTKDDFYVCSVLFDGKEVKVSSDNDTSTDINLDKERLSFIDFCSAFNSALKALGANLTIQIENK